MNDFEQREEELIARQIDFLATASPDDWHRAANNHNWDDRLDILYWIVRQPECDKATALLIFWRGEPTGYDFETNEEEMGSSPYSVEPLLNYIVRRFNTTGYTRSEIAFDYIEAKGGSLNAEYAIIMENGRIGDLEELAKRQKDMTDPLIKIHTDLKLSKIPGRKVGGYGDTDPFYENFPEESGYSPDQEVVPEPDNDASARIRALRHGTASAELGGQVAPAPVRHADTASVISSEVRIDAAVLIGNLILLGFVAVYLKFHQESQYSSGIALLVTIAVIGYMIYTVVSNFRDLKDHANTNGMEFPDRWSTITANASFMSGGLLAYFAGGHFLSLIQSLIADYGRILTAAGVLMMVLPICALVAWCAAPLLISRRAHGGAV